MKITSLRPEDRPRERLLQSGAGVLSDAELLSLLLGSGSKGKNVVELASEILSRHGGLGGLKDLSLPEAKGFVGVGEGKAARLLALSELLARIASGKGRSVEEFIKRFSSSPVTVEEAHLLLLDAKGKVFSHVLLARGGESGIRLSPKEVLRVALKRGGSRFVLVHVHPSGNCLPSAEDMNLTRRLCADAKGIGLGFADHVIVTQEGWYSFAANGAMGK